MGPELYGLLVPFDEGRSPQAKHIAPEGLENCRIDQGSDDV